MHKSKGQNMFKNLIIVAGLAATLPALRAAEANLNINEIEPNKDFVACIKKRLTNRNAEVGERLQREDFLHKLGEGINKIASPLIDKILNNTLVSVKEAVATFGAIYMLKETIVEELKGRANLNEDELKVASYDGDTIKWLEGLAAELDLN